MILFPPAKYRFSSSLSLNVFASKAATSAVILGTLVTIKNFLLTIHVAFRASISSLSSLHKLIKALPVFPRNSGRESLTNGLLAQRLTLAKSGPDYRLYLVWANWEKEVIN